MLTIWLGLSGFVLYRHVDLVRSHSSLEIVQRLEIAVVICWLLIMSFYASFHSMSFLFSLLVRNFSLPPARDYTRTPRVAILYTCMNDMKYSSILSCLDQDYPNYHTYILDDSTLTDECIRVDNLRQLDSKNLSIIRRRDRNGFKAGNLNNMLGILSEDYKYICVIDADEIIPKEFLRSLVAIAEANKDLAFIQASHRQYGETMFGRQIGSAIDIHWKYFLPARNHYGFVYTYGHGVLFHRSLLTLVGGFPEVVSEDIAVSVMLRLAGYRGYFAYDVESSEETPPTYKAFRRRNQKVITGTLSFFSDTLPLLWRSSAVSIVEKTDLTLALSVIYLPIIFILFLSLIYGLLPGISIVKEMINIETNSQIMSLVPLMDWGMIIFVAWTVFAPLIYLIPNAARSPINVAWYCLRSGTLYLSISISTLLTMAKWTINRQSEFLVTRDRSQHHAPQILEDIEGILGFALIVWSIIFMSLSLMAFGLALMLVPLLVRRNLSGRCVSVLVLVPVLLAVAALFGPPVVVVGAAGVFIAMAGSHH
jgi:cellulose synthase/poly-beta-1,6-N-acetylglucosamine synthase-like glycosyltransferase